MHTMSMHKKEMLKTLLNLWPMHTALPVSYLKEKGYSKSLIQRYKASGWLHYLGRGVVGRPNDTIEWSGLLWGLQQLYSFHVGGKTALELQGKSHFVKFKENKVYVFSQNDFTFPKWLKEINTQVNLINIQTNLFPDATGLKSHDFGEYQLNISNAARAFCEYMYLTEKYHGFDEAYYLMENLQFLSGDIMQEALEKCKSVKVKRLVLCLAKIQNVNWYKDLDRSKIDIGSGVRQGVKEGIYDPEFSITYPKSWSKTEDESLF